MESPVKSLLFFDQMFTPKFITVIYWVLLAVAVLSGLSVMIAGALAGARYGGVGEVLMSLFTGLLVIVFGALGARIWCELLIVIFKMNEALQDIRKNTGNAEKE